MICRCGIPLENDPPLPCWARGLSLRQQTTTLWCDTVLAVVCQIQLPLAPPTGNFGIPHSLYWLEGFVIGLGLGFTLPPMVNAYLALDASDRRRVVQFVITIALVSGAVGALIGLFVTHTTSIVGVAFTIGAVVVGSAVAL